MKIIEKGLAGKINWPIRVVCSACSSVLMVDESDCWLTTNGNPNNFVFTCPVCNCNNIFELDFSEKQTPDLPQYPIDYKNYNDGKNLSNEEIDKCVANGIQYFRENPSAFYYSAITGNTHVCVINYLVDRDYLIVVSKNLKKYVMKYTDEDYKIQDNNNWLLGNKGAVLYKEDV